ncbi:hypothetical protein [Candidatus Poriferisodalis sp.]|uniref:hypothetical protein n=1 Tax=Candidatus Poriferisodalis sp. TaxID=3101277 RepID=UPI003B015264
MTDPLQGFEDLRDVEKAFLFDERADLAETEDELRRAAEQSGRTKPIQVHDVDLDEVSPGD